MIVIFKNVIAYIGEVRGYFNGFQQKSFSASLRQWCVKFFLPAQQVEIKMSRWCTDQSMGGEGN